MRVRIPYGSGNIETNIPDNWINGRCYRATPFVEAGDERAELLAAFNEPVGIESFESAVKNRSNCAVVIDPEFPDLFREFLPEFLEELESASNLSPKNILLLVANSSWHPYSSSWLQDHLPDSLRSRYPVEIHDPFSSDGCLESGAVLGNKIPVRINRSYMRADMRVLIGPVALDPIHGFRGGRTLLLPGLAHESTIAKLYSYDNISQPSVAFGQIRDNPLHIAGMQTLHSIGADLTVAPLMTPGGKLSQVIFGDASQAFLSAASRARERLALCVPEQMDIIITSGGGAPYDSTLCGALNALAAAAGALKKRGTIILAAEMAEGFGPKPFGELLKACDGLEEFAKRFASGERFVPGQWLAQYYLRLVHQHEVIIYSSGLPADDIWKCGATPAEDLQEAIEVAMQGHGQRCKICALPDGGAAMAAVGDTVSHFA